MNHFLTFDLNTGTPLQNQRYDTEKEREHLMNQARYDLRNTPGDNIWFVDVTRSGIVAREVREL